MTADATINQSTQLPETPSSAVQKNNGQVHTNGFLIEFSQSTFRAVLREDLDFAEFQELRARFESTGFVYRDGANVYVLPNDAEAFDSVDTLHELNCNDHLRLLSARLRHELADVFTNYEIERKKPFTVLSIKFELVDEITKNLPAAPSILQQFKIRPKFEIESRIVETRPGDVRVCLFIKFGTRWQINCPLSELEKEGVDLEGLHVIRRRPQKGERRLVGRIKAVVGNRVELSESYDGLVDIAVEDVWLEGSKTSFARCLKRLLGKTYEKFEEERLKQEANWFTGPAVGRLVKQMHKYLVKASPISLGGGLMCSVRDQLVIENLNGYTSVVAEPDVEYCFDAARSKREKYPWNGLTKFGPFSKDTFARKNPTILVIFPDTAQGPLEAFLKQFKDGVGRFTGGFGKIFGLTNPNFVRLRIPWLDNRDKPISQVLRTSIEAFLASNNSTIDAALVLILDEHARLPEKNNPYLAVKALLLMAGIPVQQLRVSKASQPANSLQYILQDLSVALYAKMNGTPWTVDHDLHISDELVIGIGSCELSGSRFSERQRFIGITTVFRGDGNYLLGNLSKDCSFDEYPEVLKESVLDLLREVKHRNGWRIGDVVRLVFHSYKPLRNGEISEIVAECVRELGSDQQIEFAFVTVTHEHPFLFWNEKQAGIGGKAAFVPERGTIVEIGQYTRLLAVNGPRQIKNETSPLPAPLLVHLHQQSTFRDLHYLAHQVLKFTSLSWRSVRPAAKPVTIYYSELIAENLGRLRHVKGWSPVLLNAKMRLSRWML